ncbi:hypothetical protein [Paenibacillus odorifer]|uniref:hypothetical protein n=1 Tax=Paenibacillus sp. FSL E2-0201 TaxID=2954726 RepID=UPI00096EF48B
MLALGDLFKINPDLQNDIGFSPYPLIHNGTKPVVLSADDSRYAITSESKHPKEPRNSLPFCCSRRTLRPTANFWNRLLRLQM